MPKPSFQIAWPRMRVPWQLTTTTVIDWPWAEQNRKCSNMFKGGKMGTHRSTIWHKDQGKLVIPRAAHWQTSWEATRGGLGDHLGLFAWEPWVWQICPLSSPSHMNADTGLCLQKLLCSVVDKLHSTESAHNPWLHFSYVRLLCIRMLSTDTETAFLQLLVFTICFPGPVPRNFIEHGIVPCISLFRCEKLIILLAHPNISITVRSLLWNHPPRSLNWYMVPQWGALYP